MIRSLQLKILQYLPDVSLIRLDCDSVTTPFNDRFNMLPLFSRSASSPITCFLISYFLSICMLRNSTVDRSPPIGMSSPCTVAPICLPLMQPCHTHGHAITLVNLRSLSVDVRSSSPFCAATRVPYKLYRNRPYMCSDSPPAAVRRILFFALERGSTPFAHRRVPQPFLHVYPWRFSDSTTFSASSGGVDACNSGLACVLYSFATHLARWASLAAPRPSCLDGCPLRLA